MPIKLTTPETINFSGKPVTATHVELAEFAVHTGDRVTTNYGTFTMRYGTMIDVGDGSPLRFQGIDGADIQFQRTYYPERSEGGANPATGEFELVVIPEDNQPMDLIQYMGAGPVLGPIVEAQLAAGLAASEDAAALRARVEAVLAGKAMHMLYVGVYTWLLVNGHFSGTPE